MRVFIAEKPSVAKAISDSLGIKKRNDGYYECQDGSIVTNCFGHLLERAEPDAYLSDDVPVNEKTGKKLWRRQDLPIIPEKWKKIVSSDKKKQIKIIKSLLDKASEVVNAGDPDREGQLLVDEVISYCGYKGNVTRYWQSAMDEISVKRALSDIKNNSVYYKWGLSAEGRGRADWLVGMNYSRQLTLKNKSGLISVGRVQTPVLKIVVDRDLAIENFKSKDFYNLDATFKNESNFTYKGRLSIPDDYLDAEGQLTDNLKAKELLEKIKDQKGTIKDFKKEKKKTLSKLLYTLADLQVECSRLYGFSAKKTLEIAQKLYEEHKLTTYPRSSCEYLPLAQIGDVKNILGFLKQALPQYSEQLKLATNIEGNRVFNDKKVAESAHTGIAPTPKKVTASEINALDSDCKNVYMLIVKRYISCFMPPYEYNEFTIATNVNSLIFKTTIKQTLSLGFKALDKDDNEQKSDEQFADHVPELRIDSSSDVIKSELISGKTTPPKYFTEGTLVQAMRNVAKYIDDAEEKKILKETDGLGTEATRAQIIETLKKHGYLMIGTAGKVKGKIVSTSSGREILKVIPKKLQSPALTAKEEQLLMQIQNGELSLNDFILKKSQEIKNTMSDIDNDSTTVNASNNDFPKCPKCGSRIWRNPDKNIKGKFYWHCGNKECGIFLDDVKGKPVARTEILCPKCQKPLRRFESKFKKGVFTWCCTNTECRSRFQDVKGKLGEEIIAKDKSSYLTCPECHKEHAVMRLESKKVKGKFFFVCSACNSFFSDDNGKIGQKFN